MVKNKSKSKSKRSSKKTRHIPERDIEQRSLGTDTPNQAQSEIADVLRTPPPNMRNSGKKNKNEMAPSVPAKIKITKLDCDRPEIPDVLRQPPNSAPRRVTHERQTESSLNRSSNTTPNDPRTGDIPPQTPNTRRNEDNPKTENPITSHPPIPDVLRHPPPNMSLPRTNIIQQPARKSIADNQTPSDDVPPIPDVLRQPPPNMSVSRDEVVRKPARKNKARKRTR